MQFEIIDENGNVHGPFATPEDGIRYAEDRGLGEQRELDNDSESGWIFCNCKDPK